MGAGLKKGTDSTIAGRSEPLGFDEGKHCFCDQATIYAHATESFHEIRPRLLLGCAAAAWDPDEVHLGRVTHVVNCLNLHAEAFGTRLPVPPSLQLPPGYSCPDKLQYLTLDWDDLPEQAILPSFINICRWIVDALTADPSHRVLVHCLAGVSRSASIVVAYLMKTEGLTSARALAEVQAVRCVANPNTGFRKQLLEWEQQLLKEGQSLSTLQELPRDVRTVLDSRYCLYRAETSASLES